MKSYILRGLFHFISIFLFVSFGVLFFDGLLDHTLPMVLFGITLTALDSFIFSEKKTEENSEGYKTLLVEHVLKEEIKKKLSHRRENWSTSIEKDERGVWIVVQSHDDPQVDRSLYPHHLALTLFDEKIEQAASEKELIKKRSLHEKAIERLFCRNGAGLLVGLVIDTSSTEYFLYLREKREIKEKMEQLQACFPGSFRSLKSQYFFDLQPNWESYEGLQLSHKKRQ